MLSPASAGKPIAITPNLILNLTLTLIYHTNLVTHTIPLLFLQTFLHKQGCLFFMSLFVEMPTPPYLPYPTLNPILTLPCPTYPTLTVVYDRLFVLHVAVRGDAHPTLSTLSYPQPYLNPALLYPTLPSRSSMTGCLFFMSLFVEMPTMIATGDYHALTR